MATPVRRVYIAFVAALGAVVAMWVQSASATTVAFTVTPWAFACGQQTDPGVNPATQQDNPGEAGCTGKYQSGGQPDVLGIASAGYVNGVLSLSKLCPTQPDSEPPSPAQCQADDLSAGATIGGLQTLTSASLDCSGDCQASGGSPRLNVVDSDGKFYFVSGTADEGGHITFNLAGAYDTGNGYAQVDIREKTLRSIDIVYDLPGSVILTDLAFNGNPVPVPTPAPPPPPVATPTPPPPCPTCTPIIGPLPLVSSSAGTTPAATHAPSAARLATTGSGPALWLLVLIGVGLVAGGAVLVVRRS